MSGEPRRKKRRGRRRRRSKALAPLAESRRLDLDLPGEVPLSDQERAEIQDHLEFLRRYKGVLRLKLNAAEDLLVNGARPPDDRGVLKHLFNKIDRTVVEQATTREPLRSNAPDRVRFLAGVVRLNPSLSSLLSYLEALADSNEKRDAAKAFGLVVERVEFSEASPAQVARLVELAKSTFREHELTQVVLGLMSSKSFADALGRGVDRLDDRTARLFSEVSAAHRTVILGEPMPSDDAAREQIGAGVDRLLAVPDPVLRAYPDEVRRRLAEHAMARAPLGRPVRALIDSVPHRDPQYASLALAWSEKLLAEGEDDRARGVLEQIVQSHPDLEAARDRLAALGWPRLGRVAIMPGTPDDRISVRRGFWLDGSSFVWIRTGPREEADRVRREGELQVRLTVPGVLPALAFGTAEDGTPYVVLARRGKPMIHDRAPRKLTAALDLARAGLALLKALSCAGVELPDTEHRRFAVIGKTGLELMDLDGARATRPEQADVANALLARRWVQSLLADQADLPADIQALLGRRAPLPVLIAAIDRARARLTGP